MNNPFLKTLASRLLYTGIWVVVTITQILLLWYYVSDSDKVRWPYILYDSLVFNTLQAVCLLVLWYPVQYYRNIVSIPLFVLFHLLLFVIASTIGWGAGYLMMQAVWVDCPLYSEFFLHVLPARIFFGLSVYIPLALVYYVCLMNSAIKKQKEVIEESKAGAKPAPIEKLSRISVKKRQEIRFIPVSQIHCIEASGDYVMIYTANDKFLKDQTMKYWETHLPEDVFVRIHRSFIVNIEWIAKIERYEKETCKALLKNGNSLKVSNAGYKLLKQKLQL
ncbi:MAG: LytTR family transcriptional regulator [Dysgonamonadaceae bacterium]|jgi:hypothetical protein|nr:LytTR family transcriptional regulator [Dysgonamonadaceae bacterium]